MKNTKKIFLFTLITILINALLIGKIGFVKAEENTLPDNINIIFSEGDLPNKDNVLFENIIVENVEININGSLIVPGKTFNDIVENYISEYYKTKKLDNETFYFNVDQEEWAYTFTGWHIVGTTDYLPAKTVYQPGDLILSSELSTYIKNGTIELEAVWGKCYFVKNPYTIMKYKEVVNQGWILDEEKSLELSGLTSALSSDANDGRTPTSAKATMDELYKIFRNECYTTKEQNRLDAYRTVVMLAGDFNYVRDTNAKYLNSSGVWTSVSTIFGQTISDSKTRTISLTFKSLQDQNKSYNLVYKPKGYYNQIYGNFRFDNINLISFLKTEMGNQTVGSEFQLFKESNVAGYFESTARFNQSIPSGRSGAISTFRPSNFDLVVLNGGTVGTFQTSWQTDINTPTKTIEWFVGRKGKVTSYIHCGTTSAYETTVALINVNFNLTVTGGYINSIFGASKGVNATSKGTRKINIIGNGTTTQGEYNPEVVNIYGGAHQSKFYGDIFININNNHKITNVYGGGNEYTATTYGNINIDIKNSIINGDIYGGGKNANSEKNSSGYGGDVNLNIYNSKVYGNIYGSGMGMTQTIEVVDNTYSNNEASKWFDKTLYPNGLYPKGWEYPLAYDENGNIDEEHMYYYPKYDPNTGYVNIGGYKSIAWTDNSATSIGFKHATIMAYLSLATVENVEINIDECQIGTKTNGKGNIYGGGSIARVLGNTSINITGKNTIVYGSVYGGGDGVSVPGSVTVYKPLSKESYVAPSYVVESYNASGIPTNVTINPQSPSYSSSTYGVFKWSNDLSLLDRDTPGIDLDNKLLYSPNTIGLGKVVGDTSVSITDCIIYGDVYGGGNKGIVEGNTLVEISGQTVVGHVYGGCNQSDVMGSTQLTINGGTINDAYGGNNQSGVISSSISVTVEGGSITNLYGGGNEANASCNTTLTVDKATITNLYGGGKAATIKDINITTNSQVEIGNLYGGGDQGNTLGNIEVNASGKITNLYGGANKADVEGSISVQINNANIESCYGANNLSGNLSEDIRLSVNNSIVKMLYGGGNEADALCDTIVTIISSEIDKIYGGGKDALINNTTLNINGGTYGYIYGGGFQGNIKESSTINITDDAVINNNIYGGGENGNIEDSTSVNIKGATINGSIYGGGLQGNVKNNSSVTILGAHVKKNIYGGGYAGTVNSTNVLIDESIATFNNSGINILIEGNVFGGGEGVTATVYATTSTIINLNLNTTVTEQLLSTDKISGKAETSVVFVEGYSRILGNVYGGGDLAQVGEGLINTANNTASVSKSGSSYVEISNGYIGGSVFGGGNGIPKDGVQYDIYMGTIFGHTLVNVYGGYVGSNIYGGGTQSRLYKNDNETNYVATVNIIEDENNIIINGSVFGGGDRGNSATTNASVATTIGDVVINILNENNASSKTYFLTGGVYGDGNLCLVNGQRTVNMKNFTTGNEYLKTFYSLQRADVVNLDNTDIVLLGAIDLVEEGDTTIYSVNRIKQVNMLNGSTIKLDQIVKYMENIHSDTQPDRKFIINGNNGSNSTIVPSELDPLTDTELKDYIDNEHNKNIICVANGLYLELLKENNQYGDVKGLFTLQLLRANYGEGGGFVYASLESSTGDFVCFTKYSEDGEYMAVVDDKGGYVANVATYYCWFIQGRFINYSVAVNGYIGSEEKQFTETALIPTHEDVELYYILNTITVEKDSSLYNAIVKKKYDLVTKNTGLKDQEIALEMRIAGNSWFLDYNPTTDKWSLGGYTGANNISDQLRNNILASNVVVDSMNSQAEIILHKSQDVNAEITNMQFYVEILKYQDDPNKENNIVTFDETYQLNFKVGFSIVRLVPVQNSYYGPYANYAGLGSSKKISITSGSTLTFEYQTRYIPSAFPSASGEMVWALSTQLYSYYIDSLGNYMTLDKNGNAVAISSTLTLDPSNPDNKILVEKTASGTYQYVHENQTIVFEEMTVAQSSYIPKGTKITMIDLTLDKNPGYYYYICHSDKDYINLLDFMKMGTNTKIDGNINPEFVNQYSLGQSSRIFERLIFILDFENCEFNLSTDFISSIYLTHNYGKNSSYVDIMDYVKTDINFDNITYTRSYPKVVDYTICTDEEEDGVDGFELGFELDEYYDDELAKIVVNINKDDLWINTKLIDGKFGIKIQSVVDGGKLPDGIEFIYKDVSYYPQSKNQYVIIPLSGFGKAEIYVKNILGTIKTTQNAEFIGSLVILPDTQYINNNLSNIHSVVDITINCSIKMREKGYLKVEVDNPILSLNDNLSMKFYLKGQTNIINTQIYYRLENKYVLLNMTLPQITATENGNNFEIPIQRLQLEKGVYKLVFTSGKNEEIINIIVN